MSTSTMNPRTRVLLEGPVIPILLRMAAPNVLVMLAQASTGLIETWWVGHLGTDALAGMALVFPGFMMMSMFSGGAMGGGISSAIARALGGGRRQDAEALVVHALVINGALGLLFSAIFLIWGETIYRGMGGRGESLSAAMQYSNVVFAGNVILWSSNALASVLRGTGNMFVPAMTICVGIVLLIPLSPLLIFGWGPIPALGIAGGGWAVVLTNVLTLVLLGIYLMSGRAVVHLRLVALRAQLFWQILRVGAVAAISTFQTTITVALATALVGHAAGPDAVAGFGTASRLEYLMIPVAFGLGGPLVALVGTNIGAGQKQRALRIALTGGAVSFVLTETIGLAAAIWPHAWLSLFDTDPAMLATGVAYLQVAGPCYGFFGMGMTLYFASQGAGRLLWPLLSGLTRMVIAVGGGWLAMTLTGRLDLLFVALAVGLAVYGTMLMTAIASGVWFRGRPAGPDQPQQATVRSAPPAA